MIGRDVEIDGAPSGRDGRLCLQTKASGGGSEQIKGTAGHVLIDHLSPDHKKDHITGLVYVDRASEPKLRYGCVRALYEIFGGSPDGAKGLHQKLLGGSIPGNAAVAERCSNRFLQIWRQQVGEIKERFENQLRDLQNMNHKRLSPAQGLELLEPFW